MKPIGAIIRESFATLSHDVFDSRYIYCPLVVCITDRRFRNRKPVHLRDFVSGWNTRDSCWTPEALLEHVPPEKLVPVFYSKDSRHFLDDENVFRLFFMMPHSADH